MAYPPQIEQLCKKLQEYIKANFNIGDKMPAEPELSKVMCCSSRTLGIALRKLASKGIVERNYKGTFVKNYEEQIFRDEPLTVLLPCADFESKANSSSKIVNRYIIDAAVQCAMKYKKSVITIPVTESNEIADINIKSLENLNSNSMIMFSSDWYAPLFPLFEKYNCRLAFFNVDKDTISVPEVENCFKLHVGAVGQKFLMQGLSCLKQCGAKNILCAGCEKSLAFDVTEKVFDEYLHNLGLDGRIYTWKTNKNFAEWLYDIAVIYKKYKFDGLLLSPDPEQFCDIAIDLYEYLKIPESMPVLLTDSMLTLQKSIKKNAKLMYLPMFEYYLKGADFLLSGKQGNEDFHLEYQILDIE